MATWHLPTDPLFPLPQAYALKQISRSLVIEQGQQKAILNEMIIMKLLVDVPAVVRLHDALEDSVSVYFVMELCKYGGMCMLDPGTSCLRVGVSRACACVCFGTTSGWDVDRWQEVNKNPTPLSHTSIFQMFWTVCWNIFLTKGCLRSGMRRT